MIRRIIKGVSSLLILSTAMFLLSPQIGMANEHVVKPADLQRALVAAAQARVDNLSKLENFFASEPGQRALRLAGAASEKVEMALPLLDDEELARLAALAERAQADFEAGALNNQQITYILIALGTAVFILLLVVLID
jgi:hypothetical protein